MSTHLERLLAVAFSIPPLLSPRSVQVNRPLTQWARTGCDVQVICGDMATAASPEWDEELVGLYPELLRYHRVPSPEMNRRLLFARLFPKGNRMRETALRFWLRVEDIPDPHRWWVGRAWKAGLKVLETVDCDAVLSFGNPMSDHLVGLALKRRSGLPWVAHFSDPWVDSSYKSYTRFARAVNARQERKVVSRADRVVFVSEETLDLVMRKYPPEWRAKARVVPHGFDPTIFPAPGSQDSRMVFRHLGTFYRHRTPEPLFRALSLLYARNDDALNEVLFELVGPCYPPSLIDDCLAPFKLPECIAARPPVPYLESLRLMVEADVLISMDAPADLNVFLPSKLVDYLGAGRALLGITPLRGPSADLIRKAGGIAVDPEDTEGIARAICTYVREYRAGTLLQNRAAGDALRSAYEVEPVARQFQALLEEAMSDGSDRGGR